MKAEVAVAHWNHHLIIAPIDFGPEDLSRMGLEDEMEVEVDGRTITMGPCVSDEYRLGTRLLRDTRNSYRYGQGWDFNLREYYKGKFDLVLFGWHETIAAVDDCGMLIVELELDHKLPWLHRGAQNKDDWYDQCLAQLKRRMASAASFGDRFDVPSHIRKTVRNDDWSRIRKEVLNAHNTP